MYTEKTPTFDAIQWDGTNATEIETRLLETAAPGYHLETVVEAGTLVLKFQYGGRFEVPASGWVVSAPGWGDGPRESRIGLCQVLTDAAFLVRFQTAPS